MYNNSFFDTVGGQQFVTETIPSLVNAINRLADAVEKANALAANGREVIASAGRPDGCE